ncbi:MAG TPA: hypothetical protein DCE41_04235 [Cytophagales bacterium]|nr:hypothetical protein [Cytophagales bacterium]HAA24025.1 hypothetical protein [Cytophagales bacterium]HAP61489.1 hypothetical protein [Cytophagales bacterium]
MADLKTAVANLKAKISDKIEDAASLEVATFSGTFEIETSSLIGQTKEDGSVDKFSVEKVLSSINSSTVNSKLSLVAYSLIKLDGDQANIVKSTLNEQEKELVNFHRQMIEASQKSRQAIVDMVAGLLKIPTT